MVYDINLEKTLEQYFFAVILKICTAPHSKNVLNSMYITSVP